MNTKTYRGRSLEELLPKVRAELGPDAVIVRQREGLTGGVGGFFQKRLVEIEAAAPDAVDDLVATPQHLDVVDDTPATPDFLGELARAQEAVDEWTPTAPLRAEEDAFVALELPEVVEDETWSGWGDSVATPEVT